MRARWLVLTLPFVMAESCPVTTGPNPSGTPGYLISSVHLSPASTTVVLPDSGGAPSVLFVAQATGKSGTILPNMTFAWSSSNEAVAIVDQTGLVTALGAGTVEITASADKIGHATLTILPPGSAVP